MSHTPGPWFSSPVYKGEWELDGATIGPFPTGEGTDRPHGDTHHESTICEVWDEDCAANAALIAAAPELLEVLRDVALPWLELRSNDETVERVRDLIHRATTPEPRRYVEPVSENTEINSK